MRDTSITLIHGRKSRPFMTDIMMRIGAVQYLLDVLIRGALSDQVRMGRDNYRNR